jgi:hypothetical protein
LAVFGVQSIEREGPALNATLFVTLPSSCDNSLRGMWLVEHVGKALTVYLLYHVSIAEGVHC